MSANQQQPLTNTANADTTGLAGNNAHKTTLGNRHGGGNTGYGGNSGGGYGAGPISSADNYNGAGTGGTSEGVLGTQVPVQQGPFGSGTGTEARQNDGIAKPIDWEAINSGRGGSGGAPYGLTGRAGQGGGVGAPAMQDLGAGNDPTNTMGPSSGFQDGGAGGYAAGGAGYGAGNNAGAGGYGAGNNAGGTTNTHPNAGRHGLEAGAVAGGVHGHHGGQGHTGRDAAVGAATGGAIGHEERKHAEHNAETGKPSLMDKVKNVLKPNHGNNTDPANTGTNDNTGGNVGNVGATGGTGTNY